MLRNSGPAKGLVQQGIATVAMAPTGDIIVGGGDGTVSIMKHDQEGQDARFLNKMPLLATTKLGSKISSLTVDEAHSNGRAMSAICGTHGCDKFRVTYDIQVCCRSVLLCMAKSEASLHLLHLNPSRRKVLVGLNLACYCAQSADFLRGSP